MDISTPNLPQTLCTHLNEILYGKQAMIRVLVASFLAGGHVLLEGLPGLGKTVLAKALAGLAGLDFKRIQFTPDLLPTDITGTHILEESAEGRTMRFLPGPLFCHFLLADEINRASPKTQSAMLEAMAESSVTLMGETRLLPAPFFVIATQNPIEMEGTNPLPEAQLDRFAVKIDVPSTGEQELLRMIQERPAGDPAPVEAIMDRSAWLEYQTQVDKIFLPEAISVFIARLVVRTDPNLKTSSASLRNHVRFPASPRAAIWLTRLARALALLDGRPGVGFEDVTAIAPHVLGHRLILHYTAHLDGIGSAALVEELLQEVEREVVGS